jgi:hypothetical protein
VRELKRPTALTSGAGPGRALEVEGGGRPGRSSPGAGRCPGLVVSHQVPIGAQPSATGDGPRAGCRGREAPFLIGLLSHLFGAFG